MCVLSYTVACFVLPFEKICKLRFRIPLSFSLFAYLLQLKKNNALHSVSCDNKPQSQTYSLVNRKMCPLCGLCAWDLILGRDFETSRLSKNVFPTIILVLFNDVGIYYNTK